jgi:hypothetical protein
MESVLAHRARSRLQRLRLTPLLLLAGLAACTPPLGPLAALPDQAVAFTPPPEFEAWWAKTEACSGRAAEPRGIVWYVVPDASGFASSQGQDVGFWSRGTNGARIIIAGTYMGNEMVVRHEMLHALLDRGDHPPEYFVTRCHLTWDSWQG